MPEQWYPFALVELGPDWKLGTPSGALLRHGRGAVIHSAEGSLESALSVLRGDSEVSWLMTIAKDGRVYQHYPLNVITWHARSANDDYAGIECEGVAGEGLTDAQLAALVHVLVWLSDQESWPGFVRGDTLFEHNEFVSTSCPSGRIPWDVVIARCLGAPAPSAEAQLRGLVAAAFVLSIGNPLSDLGQEDRDAIQYVASQL